MTQTLKRLSLFAGLTLVPGIASADVIGKEALVGGGRLLMVSVPMPEPSTWAILALEIAVFGGIYALVRRRLAR